MDNLTVFAQSAFHIHLYHSQIVQIPTENTNAVGVKLTPTALFILIV